MTNACSSPGDKMGVSGGPLMSCLMHIHLHSLTPHLHSLFFAVTWARLLSLGVVPWARGVPWGFPRRGGTDHRGSVVTLWRLH